MDKYTTKPIFTINDDGSAHATIWIHPDDVKFVIEDCMRGEGDIQSYMDIMVHFAIARAMQFHESGQ